MKIYAEFTSLPNPQEPAKAIWPDSCWLLSDRPLYIPDFASEFVAITALAGKIGRLGKCIASRFAHRYVAQWTVAFIILPKHVFDCICNEESFDAADLCFDNAVVLGEWNQEPPEALRLAVLRPGRESLYTDFNSDTAPLYSALVRLSTRNTLKMGDVILAPVIASQSGLEEGLTLSVSDTADSSATPMLSTRFK